MTDNVPAKQNGGLQLAKEIPVSKAGVTPTSFAHIYALAKAAVAGGFGGKQRDERSAAAAIAYGMECGFTPFQALQRINVIQGTPSIDAEGCLSKVLESGLLEDMVEEVEGDGDNLVATCTVTRKGMSPHTYRLTAGDMRAEGLWGKGMWQKMPRHMLALRCRARALRDRFADVTGGLYTREEVEDFEPRRGETRTLTPPGRRDDEEPPEDTPQHAPRPKPAPPAQDAEYEVEPEESPKSGLSKEIETLKAGNPLEAAITETGDDEADWEHRRKLIGRLKKQYRDLQEAGGHPEMNTEFEDMPNEELARLLVAWRAETEKLVKKRAAKGKMAAGKK